MKREIYYNPSQVAALYGVDVSTIRRWIHSRYIKSLKLPSGHYKIAESAILEYEKDCEKRGDQLYLL